MTQEDLLLQYETRRHFFARCGLGLGKLGLLWLLCDGKLRADTAKSTNPMMPRPGNFPAKAKNVIYLFMAGAPSQFELYDYKPALQKYHNQPGSGLAHGGQTIRVHGHIREGTPEVARHHACVQTARPFGRVVFRTPAAYLGYRGRHHVPERRGGRKLQSRSREVLYQHGIDAFRTSQYGLVDHLRDWE